MSDIEWEEEWVEVGYVKMKDKMRDKYKVCLEGEEENEYVNVEWTDEFVSRTEDFKIVEDMMGKERVYKKTQIGPVCEECGTDAFHDQYNQEYYCPSCEQ